MSEAGAAAPPPRAAVVRAAAAAAAARRRIAERHAAGGDGWAVAVLASELCDAIVGDVWESIVADLPAADAARVRAAVTLVAHGGFGRGEMAPWSDLDLMILHDGRSPEVVADVARRLLQDLFDAGLEVGQSVRTAAEAVALAGGDATIMSSLLDCRRLAGPEEPLARLRQRLRTALARGRRRHIDRLVEARREEADKHGRTVFVLEPNVKRSPGGLRDIQLIRWLGRLAFGAETIADLAQAGGISRSDADAIRDAREFLMRIRNDLHLTAGKAADELSRSEQVRIAAARGIEASAGLLGVERFMREYFGHTRRVARVVDTLLRLLRRAGPVTALAQGLLAHDIAGTFRVGPAEVAVPPGRLPAVTGSLREIVRLAELSMLYEMPVAPETWEAVRAAVPALPAEPDAAAVEAFVALFAHPARVAAALRWLHDVGALEILVPQFAHARNLLQFNSFHTYTVDEHCLIAIERAAGFAAGSDWLAAEWRALGRKRPLLLALLLHDVGKGFEEDHSILGARIARDVGGRLGLPADETEIVEFLVLKHLAMAHLAFRRDVGDDTLLASFAGEVGSPEVLRMLALLTAADVGAVGEGTWTKWKSDLLAGLFYRTLGILDGEGSSAAADRCGRRLADLVAARGDDPVAHLARDLPPSYLAAAAPERIVEELGRLARLPAAGAFTTARWQPDTSTVAVTIGAREDVAAGIFHRVTGSLTSQRLEILAADIHTLAGGLVIDHFTVVDPDFSGAPPADRLADIAAAARAAILGDQPPAFAPRWNPFAPQVQPVARGVRVAFDNQSSRRDTILEVFAHDSPGLLYGIAKAIFDAGLSVQAAKIGTYLDQVVDAFHVTTAHGGKVTDVDVQQRLRIAIEKAAAPVTGPR
ncbi:MAG: [protein-PII] uridylyltransferase [Planctomycetaceae bacterium]